MVLPLLSLLAAVTGAGGPTPRLVIQSGHPAGAFPHGLGVSRDGARIAAGDYTGNIVVYDVPSAKQLGRLKAPVGLAVNDLRFSDDGRRLFALGLRDVLVWDVETEALVRATRIGSQACLGTGGSLAAGSNGDRNEALLEKTIHLQDGEGVETRRLEASGYPDVCAISPDGRWLAAGEHAVNDLIEAKAAADEAADQQVQSALKALHAALDGKQQAPQSPPRTARRKRASAKEEGSAGGQLELWDLTGSAPGDVLAGHSAPVMAMAFSRDGALLASVDREGEVHVWNVTEKKLQVSTTVSWNLSRKHPDHPDTLAFAPDGGSVVVSRGPHVRRIDVRSGATLADLEGRKDGFDVALGPDAAWVAMVGNDPVIHVTLVDWKNRVLRELRPRAQTFIQTELVEGRYLYAMSSAKDVINLWDLGKGEILKSFAVDTPDRFAVTPDGKRLALFHFAMGGPRDPPFRTTVIDTASQARVSWTVARSPIRAPVFIAGGAQLLAFSEGGKGVTLDTANGHVAEASLKELRDVASVLVSPDEQLVAVAQDKFMAGLFDLGTGQLRCRMTPRDEVYSPISSLDAMAFSPAEPLVAIGKDPTTVHLFSYAPGDIDSAPVDKYGFRKADCSLVRRLTPPIAHPGLINDVAALAFSPDGRRLAAGTGPEIHTLSLWDPHDGRLLAQREDVGGSRSLYFSEPLAALVQVSDEGVIRLLHPETLADRVTLVGVSPAASAAILPDGHYMARAAGLPGVAFRIGGRAYPFEQFDLALNRPDLVLGELRQTPPELLALYKRAYEKRLARSGVTEGAPSLDVGRLPRVTLGAAPSTQSARLLNLPLAAEDTGSTIERLVIRVNDNAVFAAGGRPIPGHPRRWLETVPIELGEGRNKIAVSVVNAAGLESLEEQLEVVYDGPRSRPNLYVVSVGVSNYADATYHLDFAAKDAVDIAAALGSQKKRYGKIIVTTLTDAQVTREGVLAAKGKLQLSRPDDDVVVFFAGHGMRSEAGDYYFATQDTDFSHPEQRGLSQSDLDRLLDGIGSRHKLLLMDTCQSGEADFATPTLVAEAAAEGLKARAFRGLKKSSAVKLRSSEAFELMREQFADLRRGTGTVVIASASGMQNAIESAEWSNGLFTYVVLTGLKSGKADRNKDGAVSVSELREHVTEEVGRLSHGLQVPASRYEPVEFDHRVW